MTGHPLVWIGFGLLVVVLVLDLGVFHRKAHAVGFREALSWTGVWVTLDPFIIYTSNVFAILGLRSLYFVLAGMANKFHYLKTGLGVVLAFVGVKMLLAHTPYTGSIPWQRWAWWRGCWR